MNSYRLILITIAIVLTVWAVKVYAGSVTMTSYYPAPAGSYDNMSVKKVLTLPCYTTGTTPTMPNNSMWIDMGAGSCS